MKNETKVPPLFIQVLVRFGPHNLVSIESTT
jgi:hypothetical protein